MRRVVAAARFIGGASALFAALAVLNATSAVLLPQQRVPFAAAAFAHVLLVAYDQMNRLQRRLLDALTTSNRDLLRRLYLGRPEARKP